MDHFENIGRRLPYSVTEFQIEALKARCRARTTRHTAVPRSLRLKIGWSIAAAVVLCAGILRMAETMRTDREETTPTVDELIAELPDDVLLRIAERNYDDLMINDKL